MAAKKRHRRQEGKSQPNAGAPPPPEEGAPEELGQADRCPPVVGLGSSAGGLEALTEFFKAMPPGSGMAFVVVSHLDPEHKSALGEILSRTTPFPVHEVKDNMLVQADHVYVMPPNSDVILGKSRLRLTRRSETRGLHLPIDVFFRSLADECHDRSVGVVLSGTGSDGALGLKAIKEAGGVTFAQDGTARHGGMPHSAVATGCVDLVLPPTEIARRVQHLAQQRPLGSATAALEEDGDLLQILRVLSEATGVDFVHYKRPTLLRRIQRRLLLRHLDTLAEYLQCLRDDRAEIQALFEEVLLTVTRFFRDPEVFEALKAEVFPRLLADRPTKAPMRVWVPGCASGEEAYSIAISLLECLEARTETLPIKIFATDISTRAIEAARAGVYGEGIAAEVSPSRLHRFFVKVDRGYQVSKAVRDLCVFARHDVTRDPPFSQLDLVSCRNLLIYLGPILQGRVLPVLHYALKPGGILVLSRSETVGSFTDIFEVLDKKCHFYVRTATRSQLSFDYHTAATIGMGVALHQGGEIAGRSLQDVFREADRVVLERFGPPGVIVDENMRIVQFRGRTSTWLEPPSGTPTNDLLPMAREGLLEHLHSAFDRARRDHVPVQTENARVKTNDHWLDTQIEVIPLTTPSTEIRYFVVLFEGDVRNRPAPTPAVSLMSEDAKDQEIQRLRWDVQATRSYLQSVIEEKEAGNEELQAANEEIISANEELQSTNEELETAKEELEATNEELQTLNDELQDRIRVANQLGDDLANLIESVNIPIVVLGSDLCIRSFSASAQRALRLRPADVGRPIGELKLHMDLPQLESMVHEVLEALEIRQRETQDDQGAWHRIVIRPYKTSDNKITGAVLAFIDIDRLKRAEEESRHLAALVEASDDAIFSETTDGTIRSWNPGAERLYGYKPQETIGQSVLMLVPSDLAEEAREQLARCHQGERISGIQTRRRRKDGTEAFVAMTISPVCAASGAIIGAMTICHDDSERRQAEETAVRRQEDHLRAVLQTATDAIITIDRYGIMQSVNSATEHMFGYDTTEMIGQNVSMLMPSPYCEEHDGYVRRYQESGQARIIGIGREVLGRRKDGSAFPVDLAVSEIGHLGLYTGIIRDISRRKELEREVLEISTLEQRRIGQDLHDDVGQELTALTLLARSLTSNLPPESSQGLLVAGKLEESLKRVLRTVRTISRGLVPVEVDKEGLMHALTGLAARVKESPGVECVFECPEPVELKDSFKATHLFRIAQEASQNALKHSQAKHIRIALWAVDDRITLEVTDDGIGISLVDSTTRGLGLYIMRNRASVINASLILDAIEPHGTRVTCTLATERSHGQRNEEKHEARS